MLFFADGEMASGKNLLLNFFFPSFPNDLKLLQYFFLTCIGRFVGMFDLIHIYLGIVKSFQTLHDHMIITGIKAGVGNLWLASQMWLF